MSVPNEDTEPARTLARCLTVRRCLAATLQTQRDEVTVLLLGLLPCLSPPRLFALATSRRRMMAQVRGAVSRAA